MGNEKYCEIGDMPVAWCAHCRGDKTPEEEIAAQKKTEEDFIRSLEKPRGKH